MRADRQMIADHLRLANEHVDKGQRQVARQRDLVANMQRDGHDVSEAKKLLAHFEGLQAMYIADRDRLIRELAESDRNPN